MSNKAIKENFKIFVKRDYSQNFVLFKFSYANYDFFFLFFLMSPRLKRLKLIKI